jgi:hypothetical protein
MDEYTPDAFSNRDEAVPVVPAGDKDSIQSKTRSKLEKVKASLPIGSSASNESEGESQLGRSIQNRLFAR